jgi:hypothetical protein
MRVFCKFCKRKRGWTDGAESTHEACVSSVVEALRFGEERLPEQSPEQRDRLPGELRVLRPDRLPELLWAVLLL